MGTQCFYCGKFICTYYNPPWVFGRISAGPYLRSADYKLRSPLYLVHGILFSVASSYL